MCIFNHGSLDDIIHNGNHPSVWASMELAVQDSNVSFGSVIDPNLFSLSIYEIKKCILLLLHRDRSIHAGTPFWALVKVLEPASV